MHILIVDDEPLARERMQQLVAELQPSATLHAAADGVEALQQIGKFGPDIVLLDIRMPRMDGLEVARHVLKLDNQPAIVFTTAYQDHALSAFDANAVDYLLKPIRKERLQIALERARVLQRTRLNKLTETISENSKRTHVSAIVNGVLELIPVERIYYLKADQKYVTAAWPGGEILLDEPLVNLEDEFPDAFVRIHRNALVARKRIQGLGKNEDNQHYIKLQEMKEELQISRRHLASVREIVNRLGNR